MSTSAPVPEKPDPLARLKERLAAFVLVALAGIAALAAVASCLVAIVGQLLDSDSPPGWVGIALAGGAGSRLLAYAYRRLVEPPDRRVIRLRLR